MRIARHRTCASRAIGHAWITPLVHKTYPQAECHTWHVTLTLMAAITSGDLLMRLTPAAALETSERELQDAREAGAVGYMSRLLVQATLPHQKPTDGNTYYERRNGALALSIMSPPSVGLPYGTYPRMLLAWITTEAVRMKSPEIELGDSLSQFMSQLGLAPTGGRWGSISRLRDHCRRLFTSTISWTYEGDASWAHGGVKPIEHAQMFWDPKRPDQLALGGSMRSFLRLSHSFYAELLTRPVPLDMRVMKRLVKLRSPLAIDIYTWLTYRVSYLREPVTVQWEWLSWQFGGDYTRVRAFKQKFIQWLTIVRQVADWRDLNVEPTKRGLKIRPSLPHVLPECLT